MVVIVLLYILSCWGARAARMPPPRVPSLRQNRTSRTILHCIIAAVQRRACRAAAEHQSDKVPLFHDPHSVVYQRRYEWRLDVRALWRRRPPPPPAGLVSYCVRTVRRFSLSEREFRRPQICNRTFVLTLPNNGMSKFPIALALHGGEEGAVDFLNGADGGAPGALPIDVQLAASNIATLGGSKLVLRPHRCRTI
jgi:hypothetical protein